MQNSINKRGQSIGGGLVTSILALAIAGVVLVLATGLASSQGTSYAAGSAASNASIQVQNGLGQVASQFPTLGLAVAFVAVIGAIIGIYYYFRGSGAGM